MKPKERAEQWRRIYEEGGEEALDEAISECANTNPVECINTIEAAFIVDGDDEGLEEFQAEFSRECRRAIDDHITRDGFVVWDDVVRLARERGMDDTADKIARYLQRLFN